MHFFLLESTIFFAVEAFSLHRYWISTCVLCVGFVLNIQTLISRIWVCFAVGNAEMRCSVYQVHLFGVAASGQVLSCQICTNSAIKTKDIVSIICWGNSSCFLSFFGLWSAQGVLPKVENIPVTG